MWGEKRARVELFGGQEILNDGMINRISQKIKIHIEKVSINNYQNLPCIVSQSCSSDCESLPQPCPSNSRVCTYHCTSDSITLTQQCLFNSLTSA